MKHRLNVEEAAEYAGRHPGTIRRLLETKDLHGSQPKKRGHWTIRPECIDAYLDGVLCEHKQNVTPIRARRSA